MSMPEFTVYLTAGLAGLAVVASAGMLVYIAVDIVRRRRRRR